MSELTQKDLNYLKEVVKNSNMMLEREGLGFIRRFNEEYQEALKLIVFIQKNSKCEITQAAIRLYEARAKEKYFTFNGTRILPEYDEKEINKGIDDAIKAEQED